ncbi:MAG: prepilin-type N-terminal cleavage/methylation domain-containing protein [Burkholderiales bacterium]|jgi:general secretion pathway protein G|nr:prepilin-type N-terminal cleavage/methylation domain-containing protein [Burkholderiales bacterium]
MRRRGYTLVELLVVLAVLGLLASMAMPLAEVTVQREKERELKRALWEIRDAIDDWHRAREQGVIAGMAGIPPYPPNLQALVLSESGPQVFQGGRVQRFLRRIPRDPFSEPSIPAELSWGLRSYLSSADEPREGADVFDVYSRSGGVGLNGVPLRQW